MDESNAEAIYRLAELVHQSESLYDRSIYVIQRGNVRSAALERRIVESKGIIADCERILESYGRRELPIDPMFAMADPALEAGTDKVF